MVNKGTILPLLEFGDLFLSSTSLGNRKKIQVLQNKCLRCALNKEIETRSEDLHKEASTTGPMIPKNSRLERPVILPHGRTVKDL